MSVSITDSGFNFKPVISTYPNIPDNKFKPNKIMHEWLFAAQGTGDASAGDVSSSVNFGTFDKNHFIVITHIVHNTGANSICRLTTHTDRWDNFYFPGHADEVLHLWLGSAYWNLGYEYLKKPLYLGRPNVKDTDPGLCSVTWSSNENTQPYNFLMQGYTLERPLPYCSILQP